MKTISYTNPIVALLFGLIPNLGIAAVAPGDTAQTNNVNGLSVSQCQPAMQVCNIVLSCSNSGGVCRFTGKVTVTQCFSPQTCIQGATVNVTCKRPGASPVTQAMQTNSSGMITFTTIGSSGTYTLTVNNVTKTSYTFDAADSVLSKSIAD